MAKVSMGTRLEPEDAREVRSLAAAAKRTDSWQIAELVSEALAARRSAPVRTR